MTKGFIRIKWCFHLKRKKERWAQWLFLLFLHIVDVVFYLLWLCERGSHCLNLHKVNNSKLNVLIGSRAPTWKGARWLEDIFQIGKSRSGKGGFWKDVPDPGGSQRKEPTSGSHAHMRRNKVCCCLSSAHTVKPLNSTDVGLTFDPLGSQKFCLVRLQADLLLLLSSSGLCGSCVVRRSCDEENVCGSGVFKQSVAATCWSLSLWENHLTCVDVSACWCLFLARY